jgi:hypothetical protein
MSAPTSVPRNPSMIGTTLPAQPDLLRLWQQLSQPQPPLLYTDWNGTRILNPALGLVTADKTPIVVLAQYEPMYMALRGALNNESPYISGNPVKVLISVGHPGIGSSSCLCLRLLPVEPRRRQKLIASTCIGPLRP